MAKITIVNDDAINHNLSSDMIFTDPPYNLPGKNLAEIINNYKCNHFVLISSLVQVFEFIKHSEWVFNFDFVLDAVVPKKSKNVKQPNYLHQNGFYFTKPNVKSAFNRKLRQRSDVFEANGYWPTIVRSPRQNMHDFGISKNIDAVTDILGSFEIKSVIDMFSGSGSTAIAANELNLECICIEKDKDTFEIMKRNLKFIGAI